MSYKGVIFDLDGTLVDTLEDIADAANQTLKKHQYTPHGIESYRYFVGDGLQKLIERIIPAKDRQKETIVSMMESFKVFYQRCWCRKSQPYEGIVAMVGGLLKEEIKLGVLSNKPHSFTQLLVAKFFSENQFVSVQGQIENLPKKPDPAGAFIIADKMALNPGQIVFVGDTSIDMRTGRNAGMKTIGVEWGFRNHLELEEAGAELVVQKPHEITNFILAQ